MSTLEIIALCEAVAAVIFIIVMVAITASMRIRSKARDRLLDPYGLYAPVTAAQIAELDRAAALSEAAQLQQRTTKR